jgi:hypothetical protein
MHVVAASWGRCTVGGDALWRAVILPLVHILQGEEAFMYAVYVCFASRPQC